MVFVSGSFPARDLTDDCKYCGAAFLTAESQKRTIRQILCCQHPEIEIEAIAHRVGALYHAFHPACYHIYLQNNPLPKCLHCEEPIQSLDGEPLILPSVSLEDPDQALFEAAGRGDLETVQKLLNKNSLLSGQHRFHQSTLDQAVQIASSFDHAAVVQAILSKHKISNRARSESIENAQNNFNFPLENFLTDQGTSQT